MEKDVDAARYDPGDGAIELPVKLRVHDSIFVPLAKWAMLLTGNYRCVTKDGAIDIKDAVHRDLAASRSVYNWVCGVCERLGASPDDLVPFEKYAAAANDLVRPSSAARALNNGAPNIERTDRLVQLIGGAIRHAQRRSSTRRSRRSTPASPPTARRRPDFPARRAGRANTRPAPPGMPFRGLLLILQQKNSKRPDRFVKNPRKSAASQSLHLARSASNISRIRSRGRCGKINHTRFGHYNLARQCQIVNLLLACPARSIARP